MTLGEAQIGSTVIVQKIEGDGAYKRRIMDMRFGLSGKEEMTQKDVADELGISQSYISRLEKKIIERLKKEISKLV